MESGRAGMSAQVDAAWMRAITELGWNRCQMTVARGFFRRLRGLTAYAGRATAGCDLVMVFPRCRSVHTCFMRHSIDVAFVRDGGVVLKVHETVPPWRFVSCPGAGFVVERLRIE